MTDTPYRGDEPNTHTLNVPDPQAPIHPLSEEYLEAQKAAEAAKPSELDAQREEHNRRTGSGTQ